MSARALCSELHSMLTESIGADAVWELLNPPTIEEQRRRRALELASLGGEIG